MKRKTVKIPKPSYEEIYRRGYEAGLADGKKQGYESAKNQLDNSRRETITKVLDSYAKVLESANIALTNIAQELGR